MAPKEAFAPPESLLNPEIAAQRDTPVIEAYPEQGKVRVLDVVLEVLPLPDDPLAKRFVPSWEAMKSSVCWDTPTVRLIRDMAVRLAGGIPTRSEGPTGVSKSFAVEVLAALTHRSYLRHNYSRDSDPGDTIGRFVPSDQKLAVRFQEILADKDLDPKSRQIIEKAEDENRPLTPYESRLVARNMHISGLDDNAQWRWQNGTLTGSMEYGSVYGADEVNLAPGNVVERENSALEKRPKLRIVEHGGEVIRQLTPEEKSIIDGGGVIPGVIGLNDAFWYVAAQNPWGIGGGRIEESEARRNRLQDRIVEALTPKEYEEYLRFLIKGEQPNITWNNRTYRGETNVSTEYRDLEAIPNVEVVINWLANFQHDLQALVTAGRIGDEKDIKGGSYVYSRRNMERFLDSLIGTQAALLDTTALFNSGNLVFNTNWRDIFDEALYQEYLAGMYEADASVVEDLIKASGIRDQLGQSANSQSLPAWAEKAKQNGIQVELRPGEWVLRRASVAEELGGFVTGLLAEAQADGYELEESSNEVFLKRPLRGILGLHTEKYPQRETATDTAANNGGE